MNVKDMREALKDVVDTVPRSNNDVVKLYNEKFQEVEVSNVTQLVKNIYTYIGQGPTPPPVIKYMGIQSFTRGVATEVTDPRILEKIDGNASFVKGSVDPDVLIENDEKANKMVELLKEEDLKTQIMAERANRG